MNETGIGIAIALLIAGLCFLLLYVGSVGGYERAIKEHQHQAIQAGAAEWRSGEDGEAVFTWRGE